jgi:hypothetical protein
MEREIEIGRLFALRKSGFTYRQIGEFFGVTEDIIKFVENHVSNNGGIPSQLKKIIDLIDSGLSIENILQMICLYELAAKGVKENAKCDCAFCKGVASSRIYSKKHT